MWGNSIGFHVITTSLIGYSDQYFPMNSLYDNSPSDQALVCECINTAYVQQCPFLTEYKGVIDKVLINVKKRVYSLTNIILYMCAYVNSCLD